MSYGVWEKAVVLIDLGDRGERQQMNWVTRDK
jgi:hypothetical protein